MNLITQTSWSNIYSVGHKKIDEEHKKIFYIYDKLFYAPSIISNIKEILTELVEYTKTHFQNEEKFMLQCNYHGLIPHKKEHKRLTKSLGQFIRQIPLYEPQELKDAIFEFVDLHFINHILKDDKQFHHFRRPLHELKQNFKWQNLYAVGEKSIDKEHKRLFEIAYRALDIAIKDKNQGNVKSTIIELYDYMKIHFANEEQYMESKKYKYLNYHKKQHENIISQINEFITLIPSLPREQIDRKLLEYVDIWLINHIICDDKRIVLA